MNNEELDKDTIALYTQIIQTLRMYFDKETVAYAINHLDENKYKGSIKENLQLIIKDLIDSCYDFQLKANQQYEATKQRKHKTRLN